MLTFKEIYALISRCNSWTDFTVQLSLLSNETDQGDCYERLVQLHMQTDPLYLAQFSHVWMADSRYSEIPMPIRKLLNLPDSDEGID